jgi:hypothetical protein
METLKEQAKEERGVSRYIFPAIYISLLILFLGLFVGLNLNLVSVLVVIGIVIAYLAVLSFEQKRLMKSITDNMVSDRGVILGEQTYIIEDEGIRKDTEFTEMLTRWETVRTIEEDENCLYIYVDNAAAYILPKRYFDSPIEKRDFLREVEERMEGSGLFHSNNACHSRN